MSKTQEWRRFLPVFALPTFFLAIGVYAAFFAVVAGVFLEHLPVWAGLLLNSLTIYLNFTVLHEAVHGNIAIKARHFKLLEKVIGELSGGLLVVPFSIFRQLHLIHHAFTNHPQKDPDMWVASHSLIGKIVRFCSIVPGYYIFIYRHYRGLSNKKFKAQWRRLLGFPIIYALMAIFGWLLGWHLLFALWVAPLLIATSVLAFAFNWLPHHPHQDQSKYANTRLIVFKGVTLPLMWQNYHLIHHLYPGIPFYNYLRTYRHLALELNQYQIITYPERPQQK